MNLMDKYLARVKRETPIEAKESPLRVAVKLYSPILEGYLWVVQDRERWPHLKGGDVPVYDAEEIMELEGKGLTPDELKVVHETKKVFKGTRINSELDENNIQ